MAINSDGSIGPAPTVNNINIGTNGAIGYNPASPQPVAQVGSGPSLLVQASAGVAALPTNQPTAIPSTVVIYSGVWANDAAALAAGIPVGGIYRRTDGLVVFRLS